MTHLFSSAIASFQSWLNAFQVKRFLAVVLVGFLVLTTNSYPTQDNKALGKAIKDELHQNNDQRPKTTGEWHNEAKQNVPLDQRIHDIAEDSAEAFKDFGSGYTEGAQKTAREIKRGAAQVGKDLTN